MNIKNALLSLMASAVLVIPSSVSAVYPWQSNFWKNSYENGTLRNIAIGTAVLTTAYGLYQLFAYNYQNTARTGKRITKSFNNIPITFTRTVRKTKSSEPTRAPMWDLRYEGTITASNGRMYSYTIEANSVVNWVFGKASDFMAEDFAALHKKLVIIGLSAPIAEEQETIKKIFGKNSITFFKTVRKITGAKIHATWDLRYKANIATGNGRIYSYIIKAHTVPDTLFGKVSNFMLEDSETAHNELVAAARAEDRTQQTTK